MSSEKKCVVPGCCVDPLGPEIECHSFPPLSSLISILPKGKTVYFSKRRVWLNKLGLEESSLDKNSGVCSLHFLEQDFETKGELKVLKENAIPSQKLPPNIKLDAFDFPQKDDAEQETEGGNVIETAEKTDSDDDDIEIIEPPREVITLDDDGCEEKDEKVQTNESSSERRKTDSIQDILAIRSKFGSNLKAGDYTKIRRTVNSMVKPTEGLLQDTGSATIITTDGKKFIVHKLKTVPPKGLPQSPIDKKIKFVNIRPKEISGIAEINDKSSPMMKLSVSNASKLPLRIVASKSPDSSPRSVLKRIGSLENEQKITTPKKRKSDSTSLPKSKIKKLELTEEKHQNPFHSGDVKVINIDQLLKKDVERVPVESIAEENAKGFSEIHDFIKQNVINFRFEFLGTTYVLKQCALNFSVACSTGWQKFDTATAVISNAPLSSSDDRLLNGMNVSLGISKTFDPKEFTKIVSYKQEILKKIDDVPNSEADTSSKTKTENNKRKYNKKKVDDKVVINPPNKKGKRNAKDKTPQANKYTKLTNEDSTTIPENKFENLVSIPTSHPSDATTDKCLAAKSLKIDDKGKKVAKTRGGVLKKLRNFTFARNAMKMPISQMNPQPYHVIMPNGKLKRNRRTIFNNLKEKDDQQTQSQGSYTKTSDDTIPESNSTNEKTTSVTTTRSSRQKVKKNYRNINRFGLMEEPKNIDRITKKKVESSTPAKRSNYSETVGRIESFLEVVLEPQPNDDNMDVETNKTDDDK